MISVKCWGLKHATTVLIGTFFEEYLVVCTIYRLLWGPPIAFETPNGGDSEIKKNNPIESERNSTWLI